jgi:hypothetical protein
MGHYLFLAVFLTHCAPYEVQAHALGTISPSSYTNSPFGKPFHVTASSGCASRVDTDIFDRKSTEVSAEYTFCSVCYAQHLSR